MKGFLGTIRQHTQVVRDALDMQTLRDGQGIFAQNEVGAAPATGMIRLKARTCASYRAANGVFYELLGDKKNIFVSDHIKDVVRGWGKEDAKNGIRAASAEAMPFELLRGMINLNQNVLNDKEADLSEKKVADLTALSPLMGLGMMGGTRGAISETRDRS